MSRAVFATRQEKEQFLLRPLSLASSVAFFSFVFGIVFWLEGEISGHVLAGGLVVAMGITSALLFWAMKRVTDAARGRI